MDKFHAIYRFNCAKEQFVLKGVFTKKEDAESYKATLPPDADEPYDASILDFTLDEIKAALMKETFTKVKESIEKLLQSVDTLESAAKAVKGNS